MSLSPCLKDRFFISYKMNERGFPLADVTGMCRELKSLGAVPYLFHSKEPDDIGAKLMGALKSCKSLAYTATIETLSSPWISLELYHAKRLGLSIYKYDPNTKSVTLDENDKVHLPVFPSYSTRERDIVAPILNPLSSYGILIPQDLKAGSDWRAEIEANLNRWLGSGGIIMVFLSIESLTSNWVKYEYSSGLESDQLLPILLDEIDWSDLPISLREILCVKAEEYPTKGLVYRIERMVQNATKRMENESLHVDMSDFKPCLKI